MEAAKFVDAIARFEGCDGEEADATGAYIQADLGGPPTWVKVPRDRWPKEWGNKYDNDEPVVLLKRALYGHPLAGLYWEQHCRKAIKDLGFEPVIGWECLYVHREKHLVLSVYVDDFKLAGERRIT